MTISIRERIAKRVVQRGDCMIWTGCTVRGGYGQIRIGGQTLYVHRVAYETAVGPIPDGMEVDHLCFERACVNPDHLEPVTPDINKSRSRPGRRGQHRAAIEKSKTHCPRGHAYDESNTYTHNNGRYCRACRRERYAERKQS